VLPLQFGAGDNAAALGLTGEEVYDLEGLAAAVESGFASGREMLVKAKRPDGGTVSFRVLARIDTPQEVLYYRHGGILQYVLRQLLSEKKA
jgi:aconitate hydratase